MAVSFPVVAKLGYWTTNQKAAGSSFTTDNVPLLDPGARLLILT